MDEKPRLFIAFAVPTEIRDALREVRDRLAAVDTANAFRPVSLEGLHLTLKFLGETEPEKIPNIRNRLEQVLEGRPPLALIVRGVGAFPKPERPRIVWAGLAGDVEGLAELRAAIEHKMRKFRIEAESFGLTPHITLARRRDKRAPTGADALIPLLQELKALELGGWTASEVILYQSQLQATGAIYTPLARFPLRGIPKPPPAPPILTEPVQPPPPPPPTPPMPPTPPSAP